MKQLTILDQTVVMENPDSLHNYFAWPTVTALADGTLAAVASGFRMDHLCPFGKAVISYSRDLGKSWTAPAPIIDTVLDDRDAGIAVCGDDAIVTSFNNTLDYQMQKLFRQTPGVADYFRAYLTLAGEDAEREAKALGSTFRLSRDGGVSWEKELHFSPVSAPHGPIFTKDGRLLYIGCVFGEWSRVECHEIDKATGAMKKIATLPPIEDGALPSEEPHAIELADGRLLALIRTERQPVDRNWQNGYELFTVYQTVSADGGKTWSRPSPLKTKGEAPKVDRLGAPPHLFRDRSGRIILSTAGRMKPLSLYIYVSSDEGDTWEAYELPSSLPDTVDFGYPATAECADGSYYTVWYQHVADDSPAVICGARWSF